MGISKGRKTGPRHGLCYSPEAVIWYGMRRRCLNPQNKDYPHYGGRGITICEEWNSFAVFYRDMGPRPSPKHFIERIDNEKGYFPENCRWATSIEQHNNKRNNRKFDWKGQKMTPAQIFRTVRPPLNSETFKWRLYRGWSVEEAISEPVRR